MPFSDFLRKNEEEQKPRKIVYGCEKTHSVDSATHMNQQLAYEKQQKLYHDREMKRKEEARRVEDSGDQSS